MSQTIFLHFISQYCPLAHRVLLQWECIHLICYCLWGSSPSDGRIKNLSTFTNVVLILSVLSLRSDMIMWVLMIIDFCAGKHITIEVAWNMIEELYMCTQCHTYVTYTYVTYTYVTCHSEPYSFYINPTLKLYDECLNDLELSSENYHCN